MILFRLALAGVLFIGIALAAEAHRKHVTWTTITWNERTSNLEITHRLHAHDAQTYLDNNAGSEPSIADLRVRAQVALYVADHFRIAVKSNSPASVNLLGAELEDPYLMVYQEITLSDPPTGLDVHADILMAQFPDQVNMVNIDIDGRTQTLQFREGDGSKHFSVRSDE